MRLVKHAIGMLVALACVTLVGCTSIPSIYAEKFGSAVSGARAAGEAVLVDHASIQKETEAVLALAITDAPRVPTFDPDAVELPSQTNRDVVARTRAWEALERYSNALVAVAQGNGSGLADEAKGLLQSVTALAGLSLGPGVGVLVDEIAGAIDREIQARKFAQAVLEADPLMKRISELMQADTRNFYSVRLVLYNRAADTIRDPAGERLNRFEDLAVNYAFSFDADDTRPDPRSFADLVLRINAASLTLGIPESELYDPEAGSLGQDVGIEFSAGNSGTKPYTSEAGELLLQIVLEAERDVNRQSELTSELGSYHRALTAYVSLLKQMRAAHASLRTATTSAEPELPDINALLAAAIRVRAALRSSN